MLATDPRYAPSIEIFTMQEERDAEGKLFFLGEFCGSPVEMRAVPDAFEKWLVAIITPAGMIPFFECFEKTSVSGNRYFTAGVAKARMVIHNCAPILWSVKLQKRIPREPALNEHQTQRREYPYYKPV